MKCGHCGEKLWCQACGADVESCQAKWHRRQVHKGICPRCGVRKTAKDGPHVNCRTCRLKHSERMRIRYATHGRKDRRHAA